MIQITQSRRWLLTILVALLYSLKVSAVQQTRIAVLLSANSEPYMQTLQGFKEDLKNNIKYEEFTLQPGQSVEELVAKAKASKPDIYFTVGSVVTSATLKQVKQTPVVATMVLNFSELENANNATGVVLDFQPEMQIEWLHKIIPNIKNIGMIYSSGPSNQIVKKMEAKAAGLGLNVDARKIKSVQDLPSILDSFENEVDVLLAIADPAVFNAQTAKPILLFSYRNRIPVVGLSEQWVEAGALYSLNRDYLDIGKQCADIVTKIRGGTPVTSLHAAAPRKIEYMINSRATAHMKVSIADKVMTGAKRIIE